MKPHLPPLCTHRVIRLARGTLAYRTVVIAAFVAVTMAIAPEAQATTVQINPSDDAYVEDIYPVSNFGNSGAVYVGDENYNEPAAICRTYAKYDLSSIPAGSTIHSATVYFRTWGIGPSPTLNVDAHDLGTDSWNEGSITWINAPTGWSGVVSDSLIPVTATATWYGWNVTGGVTAEASGDGTYSVILKAAVEGTVHSWCGFASMEQGFGFDPYLEVDYTAGPVVEFTPGQALAGVWKSDAAWADFDNDGDEDLAICGETDSGKITRTYENQSGTLVLFQDLLGVLGDASGALAWGDYDNDGDVDLAMAGLSDSGRVARIYANDSTGVLTLDAAQVLTGVANPSLDWGDVDNDGDLELYVAGHDGTTFTATLYENDPVGTLAADTGTSLTGMTSGSADFADYDNDGWLELLVTGNDGTNRRTLFYENSAGALIHDGNHGLPEVALSDVAWGDYDLDGDLDLAITGETSAAQLYARVYGNDGAGNFTQAASLLNIYRSSCAWGDYDNDGDLDVAFCGYTGITLKTEVYQNVAGIFTPTSFSFPDVREGSLNWVDPDGDGDLDLFITGADWSTKYAQLYTVSGVPANTAPQPPTVLNGQQAVTLLGVAGPLTLDWSGASDAETATNGLYYCLRVGTASGGDDIFSGTYGTPLMGNLDQQTSAELWVPAQTHYWSVRSIDAGLMPSAWSAEQICVPDTAGFVELDPIDDAYVDSNQPMIPLGVVDPTNLIVGDLWSNGSILRAYLKFSLTSIPSNATIQLAELHVFRYGGSTSPFWIDVWEEGIDIWDENTITWQNAPTMFMGPGSRVRVDGANECIWDVTSDVQGNLGVDNMLTEVLRNGSPGEGTPGFIAEFYAKESPVTQQRPFLKVWYTTPGTAAPVFVETADRPLLEQNAPNPFRPRTMIAYTVPRDGNVRLGVFDVGGRLVKELVGKPQTAGRHSVIWDGRDEAGRRTTSGVYFYRLTTDAVTETRRMVRLR